MFANLVAMRQVATRGALFVAVAALLGLAGCASEPAPYAPKTAENSTGYTDQQLTQNRYRVTFTGNSVTSRQTVENYLLLRAAEVTLQAGYQYFLFDTRNTAAKTTYYSDFVGWPGWGGYGWYWHNWAYRPYGGFGPPFNSGLTVRPVTRYQAYAEIVLLTADQSKDQPRAIDAHQIITHLRPPPPPPAASAPSAANAPPATSG